MEKFDQWCSMLRSCKVRQRTQACAELSEFLGIQSSATFLSDGNLWPRLQSSIFECFEIEHNKKLDDLKKKGGSTYDVHKCADLLVHFIRKAAQDETSIDFVQLFRDILIWLQNPSMKPLWNTCIRIFSEILLMSDYIKTLLSDEDWKNLFFVLKRLCGEEDPSQSEFMKCLGIVVELGPSYRLPPEILREEFAFITTLCQRVTSKSTWRQQSAVLEVVCNFCLQTAKDNRMACCKLGETVFPNFLECYQENSNEDKIRSKVTEFFLLQIALHNPKGVKEDHYASYALSWDVWKNCLLNIHAILIFQVETNLQLTFRNQFLFVRTNGRNELHPSFVELFVEVFRQLFGDEHLEDGPPKKRMKRDLSVGNLIEKIAETKSWAWVNLTYPLVEKYPEIPTPEDRLNLLKILSPLIPDAKQQDLQHHVLRALIVLQRTVKPGSKQGEEGWKRVADFTLRLSHQGDDEVQELLQLLITNGHIKSHESVMQLYRPEGDLPLNQSNLKTLDVAFRDLPMLQSDKTFKKQAMKWVLVHFVNEFHHAEIAKFLVSLTMKQWPTAARPSTSVKTPFEDIEDMYFNVCFEEFLVPTEAKEDDPREVYCLDQTLFADLSGLLAKLMAQMDVETSTVEFLNTCGLIFNVFSFLDHYKLVETSDISTLDLYEVAVETTENLFAQIRFDAETSKNAAQQRDIAQVLTSLFSSKLSDFVALKLRDLVPERMILSMFEVLSSDVEGDLFLRLKNQVMEALVLFSCLPLPGGLVIQKRAMEALLTFDYEGIWDLALILFQSLQNCGLKSLPEDLLESLFSVVHRFCQARSCCHNIVSKILDFLHGFLPVVVASDSEDFKREFVNLLHLFYVRRDSYGPSISVKLLNCLQLFFRLEPTSADITWSNEKVLLKIPEFLCSHHQEVRFAAIRALAAFFSESYRTRLLQQYHKEEVIFAEVVEMSPKVLEIEGEVNESRLADEVVVRTSSLFHIFASIMLASNLWIEEALYSLLKIACDKKLDLSQIQIVITKVAKRLGFKSRLSFLEKYLVGLVNRWSDLEDFPFMIFDVSSKTQFYSKFWSLLAQIFVNDPKNKLIEVARLSNKTPTTLMEESCPRLLSYSIAQEVADFTTISNNRVFKMLEDTLGASKVHKIAKMHMEEVLLGLIDFVCDDNAFKESFDLFVIFPEVKDVRLSVEEFGNCLDFIEGTFYKGNSVVSHLMQETPQKIHFILLQLSIRVNTVQTLEDKLRYFHLYSLFAILSINSVTTVKSMQVYLLRDLIHTLLHNIKNHKNHLELSRISCKFFKRVLTKVLPLTDVVSQFFLVIVTRLKFVAVENCAVSDLCIDMLEFLIVEHKSSFLNEIEKLDSLPKTPQFAKMSSVHHAVKYHQKVTFEDEIVHFLNSVNNIENLDECEHSVSHLKTLLIEKKDELKTICCTLRETSEDCNNSNLHKLICTLITLSCSSNKRVRMEAVRCLGEIGPADLATLILQQEKPIADPKWTPWELVLGVGVSLLAKYLVDVDVEVNRVASLALFQILATREGQDVTGSEDDFGLGPTNSDFFAPFRAIELRIPLFELDINSEHLKEVLSKDILWIPEHSSHEIWITKLVCTFFDCFEEKKFFSGFIAVCKLKVEFCEQMLPLIVYTILDANIFPVTCVISEQFRIFFEKHWDITIDNVEVDNITTNKASVQVMLNVIHFIRLQKNVRKKEIGDMKLDYLKVAKAAHFCTAYFTALLYAELWCQEKINELPKGSALSTCSYTKLDLIYDKVDKITGNTLQNILRHAYKSIGESDALLGCGTSHLLNPASRVEHYKELNRWDQVTQYYEREMSLGRNEVLPSLVDALNHADMYQLSLFCSTEPNYESLWRLGRWDYKVRDFSQVTYDKSKFCAMKALHENEEFVFAEALNEGRSCVVENFMVTNMESVKNFYDTLGRLQCLNEIEEFAEAVKGGAVENLLAKWTNQDEIVSNDYQYVEPVQAQRILLLTDWLSRSRGGDLNMIVEMIIGYARCARIEGNSQIAFRILQHLQSLDLGDYHAKIRLEEAQLCWSIHDVVTAKCILRTLCSDSVDPKLHATALKMTGQWMVESSSENRQVIIEEYYQKSLKLMKSNEATVEDQRSIVDTWEKIAKFADHEYQEILSHIKSDVFQKKKRNVLKTKEIVNKINLKRTTKDLQKAVAIKQKFTCIDEIEIHNIETDKNNLLILALRYYLRILIATDDHNMTIFRLFSLLLENRDNEVIKTVLEKDIFQVPTYKFIPLLPQIIPHISSTSSDLFSQAVNSLIEKCAKDHPYHTLPLILSLALSHKDRQYSSESKGAVNEVRTSSAKAILMKLKKNSNLSSLIEKMEFVSEAIIELAYYSNDSAGTRGVKVPRKSKILKVQNYEEVLLPTYNLPVDKSLYYGKVVGIMKFSNLYFNVGGINAPKRITCRGTDGVDRTQLIKGQDDLRQDAVMQQVFTIMNSLLSMNKQTKNLRIRTYKIVPLSMRSGILEWVDNTMPIAEYLTGEKGNEGAHKKFRPGDKTPGSCRAEFKNLAIVASKSNEVKLREFNIICESIQPVFHKFFETNFPQATVWYERRRRYIHSVATSSMCGYILGIGDRHLNNILIDKNTAEVVHIDFGIAFEQGRVLPTPETVPFRLTRDIVDGMGVSGVEGVFRKSCERTMEVLRLHYQTIITTLEVLLYDPLYDWTVSTAEANKRQKDSQESGSPDSEENGTQNVNETAERALLRLRAKLQGSESGKPTTVERQVGTLIQQAVDPSNLSKLFHGWQPYL